jgi:restriction system protein
MTSSLSLIFITFFIIMTLKIVMGRNNKKPKYKTRNNKTYKNPTQKSQAIDRIEEIEQRSINPERISQSLRNKENIKWNKEFLKSLEWKRYEEVCMEFLRIKNCNADVTCIGADGGIDIKIHDRNGTLFAIAQCKSWNKPIGVNLIRELYGIMASEKIKYGIFLTTSIFSEDALEFAKNKALILIDADELVNLINALNENDKRKIDQIATKGDYTTPTCVKCNLKMIKRTATKGQNAGNEFWGCVNFPRCKHIMYVKA